METDFLVGGPGQGAGAKRPLGSGVAAGLGWGGVGLAGLGWAGLGWEEFWNEWNLVLGWVGLEIDGLGGLNASNDKKFLFIS